MSIHNSKPGSGAPGATPRRPYPPFPTSDAKRHSPRPKWGTKSKRPLRWHPELGVCSGSRR